MALITIRLLLLLIAVASMGPAVAAQGSKLVILVRHAEKDVTPNADQNDPELTAEGRQRAERLAVRLKKYRIGEIFSTDTKRTRDTAAPLAARRHVDIRSYDAKQPSGLVDMIMKSPRKRFLVVGHSNTIPRLANTLGGADIFKDLEDSEHGVIWLIRLKRGAVVRQEILRY